MAREFGLGALDFKYSFAESHPTMSGAAAVIARDLCTGRRGTSLATGP